MPDRSTIAARERPIPIAPQESFSDEALLLTDPPPPGKHAQPRPQPIAGPLWIESVTSVERLAEAGAEWQALGDEAAETNPFYEPWMLIPAIRAFGEHVQVLFVFGPHPSRAKGKSLLLGVFPMARRRGRMELWRHQFCYLTAPLLRRGSERAALSCWLDWLARNAGVVRLEDVPGDGPMRLHLLDELNERGWPMVVSQAYTRAVLRCAGNAEEYLSRALAGKRRKELRRQRSRLSELGALVAEEASAGADPRAFIDELISLEAAGWKGREGVDASNARGYLQEMAANAARLGRLQMLSLRLGPKPIALKLNFISGEGAFAFKIAFDEEFSRFSPGVLLELENVERAHRLPGLRWMDSCAAPNRFMINHLWPDRREMQTVFFATGGWRGALTVAAIPLLHFVRRQSRSA